VRSTEIRRSRRPWNCPALSLLIGVLVSFSACTQNMGQSRPARSTGDITRADLDDALYTSAHHAIERLRPGWLRRHGVRTLSNTDPRPVVWVDGSRVFPDMGHPDGHGIRAWYQIR